MLAEKIAPKILIVDDEPDVVSLLTMTLKQQGFEVITARDGQQGLEKARGENPDLILLDVMLPHIDGYKVARILKFDEHYKHIPIIMVTAKVQEKEKQMGFEMGVNDYLAKPFDITELVAKIKALLAIKTEKAAKNG